MPARARLALLGLLFSVLAFALLALLLYESARVGRLDAEVLSDLETTQALGSLPAAVRLLGDPPAVLVGLLVICAVAYRRDRPADIAWASVLVLGASLTTRLVKVAFAHPRFSPLLGPDQPGGGAFPSGHMTAVASLVWAAAIVASRRWRPLVIALGALLLLALAASLPMLGAHYPSDVLGGLLIASGWGFAVLAARELGAADGISRFRAWSRPRAWAPGRRSPTETSRGPGSSSG